MKEISYWTDTAPGIPSHANRDIPEHTDVVVIGAGFTGLSTALFLAKKGAKVTVLEKDFLGGGASSRNGGMSNTGITISLGEAIRRYGLENARKLHQVSIDTISFVENLTKTEGIDCDFQRNGKLFLAFKPKHYDAFAKKQEQLERDFGHHTEIIKKEDLHKEIASNYYYGGLLDPLSAGLHVGKFVSGLVAAADRAGVDSHDHLEALELQRNGRGGWAVKTPRGIINAKQVMIATDGYTGNVFPPLKKRVLPIGSFVIASEQLSESTIRELSPHGRNFVDTKNFVFYFRTTPDNRMLFGGRAKFALSSPTVDLKAAEVLRKGMVTVYPQLANVKIDYAWGGIVGFTLDKMPHAGEMDGVYYALGYCGHGVQFATYIGKCMAEVINGHAEANPWKDLQFMPVPYAAEWTWVLPFAGAFYKVVDWLT